MHALYIVVPALGIMAIAYRYYSAFIAAKVMLLDDSRVTPAHTKYDGHNYYPTQPLGALRPSFRGHHRRRAAGRPDAGGAVRLRARVHLAGRRLLSRRRRARLDGRSGRRRAAAAGRSPRSRAPRSARSPASTGAIAILFIVVIALAGLGIVVVNALAESAVGHVHDRRDDSARHLHGLLHVRVAQGPHRGGDHHRRHRRCSSASSSASGSPPRRSGSWFVLSHAPAHGRCSASTASPPRCCRSGCC